MRKGEAGGGRCFSSISIDPLKFKTNPGCFDKKSFWKLNSSLWKVQFSLELVSLQSSGFKTWLKYIKANKKY